MRSRKRTGKKGYKQTQKKSKEQEGETKRKRIPRDRNIRKKQRRKNPKSK